MPTFDEFCRDWDRWCIEHKHLSKKQKGDEYEDRMAQIILPFVPNGQYLAPQARIPFVNKKFDFLLVEANKQVQAAIEAKAHGFYSRAALDEWTPIVAMMQEQGIPFFYICYRESNYYDRRARRVFGTSYYRFNDTGDGTEIPPKKRFPQEWDRLMEDLSHLA